MKVLVVGGGASGLMASLAIKKKNPNYDVTLIDRNDKLGKKLRATGNGKANICNIADIKGAYSHEKEAYALFKKITPNDLIKFFHSIGVETINYGPYVYPYSESANMLTDTLIEVGKKLGVKYVKSAEAIDYSDSVLRSSNGKYQFDKLVIATGLGSMPQLGASNAFVLNLASHGYHIAKPIAVLTPIRTVEKTKDVFGQRRKVHLKLVSKGKTYLSEDGELIFKKDGISGIVVYHATSVYVRNHLKDAEIIVDFLPGRKVTSSLNAYFTPELSKYLNKFKDPKAVKFHIKEFYGEKDSVASYGGVSLNDVDSNFASKIEKNVYIIGEALDQDGLCGGYNLMWAFISALKVSENI